MLPSGSESASILGLAFAAFSSRGSAAFLIARNSTCYASSTSLLAFATRLFARALSEVDRQSADALTRTIRHHTLSSNAHIVRIRAFAMDRSLATFLRSLQTSRSYEDAVR